MNPINLFSLCVAMLGVLFLAVGLIASNGEDGKGKNIITFVARKVRYGETGESDLGYNGDKCKIFNSYDGFMNSIQRKEMMDEKELPF